MLSLQRMSAAIAVWGLVLLLILVSATTVGKLITFNSNFLAQPLDVLRQWRTPHAGNESVAAPLRAAVVLLRKHQVAQFRYSKGLLDAGGPSTHQRLGEGAYPARLHDQARYVVMLAGEQPEPGCQGRDFQEGVVLVHCP